MGHCANSVGSTVYGWAPEAWNEKSSYAALRVAHVHAVRAALEDHVTRVDWPADRIERYRTERLRALLSYARSHSPFHAARMKGFDPASATVADLARLPPMVKQEAQDEWDAIVTEPGLDRAEAERIVGEQTWFSYTSSGCQVFSSGGSSGVRGAVRVVLGAVRDASRVWRGGCRCATERQARDGGEPRKTRCGLAVLEAGEPPHAEYPFVRCGDRPPVMETVVIPSRLLRSSRCGAEVADTLCRHTLSATRP